MTSVIKTNCLLNIPLQKVHAASCNLCRRRNVLITMNSFMFMPRKLSSSLMKRALRLNSHRLHTLGLLCRFTSAQSSKLSVPLKGKYTQQCRVSVAMAVGLLVGWTVLELHQHPVSCVAEATETAECHDNKQQTNRQCQVVSLDEAIYESDQLLQRVKVREKLRSYLI